jgi:membrane protease YdiL (CAAX protease family)
VAQVEGGSLLKSGSEQNARRGLVPPVLVRDLVLSAGASPYTQYLNFDKALVGLLLTGILGEGLLRSRRDWLEALRRAAPWIIATIALVLGLAFVLGQVALAPKWTPFFWLWAVTNLFFTCVAEEAFFRGFLQRELDRALVRFGGGQPLAVGGSAALFGLAHWAGGWSYVLFAALAGLGYALAFRASGCSEMAILAHFGLNATHFLLLTYPPPGGLRRAPGCLPDWYSGGRYHRQVHPRQTVLIRIRSPFWRHSLAAAFTNMQTAALLAL